MVAKITPTIEIDMDKPCNICGKTGSTAQGGICLECAGKRIAQKLQWKIGDKTMKACIAEIESLLWQYHSQINRAYTLAPGEITINLNLKIEPDDGVNAVTGGIGFTIEKLKATSDPIYVDERQEELFR
jgi:hypothetical protein